MLRFKHVIALLLAGSAQIGQALVVRADVPIASYEQEARRLPGYCRLNLPDGGGVLIASQWVLTAAHLASDVKPGHRFQCEREDEIVDKVVVYPAFDENIGRHDLALIRLAKPSKLKPVRLRREVVPGDTLASLIGHYQGGTGLTGGVGRSPAGLRGGTNRVAAADRTWLRFVFDPPGSKATSALEAVSGSGDSGAPAYMLEGRDASVIGIGSRSSDTNKNGIEQDYGDTDLYVPVASYLAWIDQVTSRSRTATTTSRVRAFAQVDGDIFDELSRQGFSGAAAHRTAMPRARSTMR